MERYVIPIGNTTINVVDVDYIDKIYDSKNGYYGIRVTFFSGAHKEIWYLWESQRNLDFKAILRYM